MFKKYSKKIRTFSPYDKRGQRVFEVRKKPLGFLNSWLFQRGSRFFADVKILAHKKFTPTFFLLKLKIRF